MPLYDNADLRREILKTLNHVPFFPFRVPAIIEALRGTGFPDLTEGSFMAQAKYLQGKGYVVIEKAKNLLTREEGYLLSITPQGVDLLEGRCTDVGVQCE